MRELRGKREEGKVRRPCGWCGSPASQRGLWYGWRGSKLQKLKNIFQTLIIVIYSVSCAIFRAFLFITLYHSLSLCVTLYHSAEMPKIKAVTSQRRSKTKGASPPPLQGEEPADIARTAALQFKGETKMRQCDDVILSESEPLGVSLGCKAEGAEVKGKAKHRILQVAMPLLASGPSTLNDISHSLILSHANLATFRSLAKGKSKSRRERITSLALVGLAECL